MLSHQVKFTSPSILNDYFWRNHSRPFPIERATFVGLNFIFIAPIEDIFTTTPIEYMAHIGWGRSCVRPCVGLREWYVFTLKIGCTGYCEVMGGKPRVVLWGKRRGRNWIGICVFVYLCFLDGAEEGGCLDWKSCVQGIFRPPPNHYSLSHSLDDEAPCGGGDKDKDGLASNLGHLFR